MDALHLARRAGLDARRDRLAHPARRCCDSSSDLAAARRRHLGGARAAPALHALEGDGMGGIRPRRQGRRGASASTGRWTRWRAAARSRSMPRSAARGSTRREERSSSPTARSELDASLLLIPLVGFLPPTDPRVRGTVDAIERGAGGGRVRAALLDRRDTSTDCRPARATSCRARFWLADSLALLGPHDEARRCSSACLLAQRRRAAARRSTTRAAGGWSATSPRPSPTSR